MGHNVQNDIMVIQMLDSQNYDEVLDFERKY